MPEPAPTLAVIGGGQLARMMAQPAIALGLPLRLLAEAEGVSAAQVIPDHLVGDYRDLDTLREVTDGCAVVTFDHEHVPTEHLHALEADGVAVRPGPEALVHAQDKARDARPARRARRARARATRSSTSVAEVEAFGFPCVLKTTRGGYDGKGVWFVALGRRLRRAVRAAAADAASALLAEELVDFRRELSALVAALAERPGGGVPRRGLDPAGRHLPRGDRARARPGARRWPGRRRRSRCGSPARST